MKPLLYIGLMLGLVPLQVTVLNYAASALGFARPSASSPL